MSKKAAYIDKAQAKIDEQAARLNELKAKAKGKLADQKIDAYQGIEKLEVKLNAAREKLAEIAGSAECKWEDLSGRLDVLTEEMRTSVKKFFGK